MNAVEIITQQHAELDELIGLLRDTRDRTRKLALVLELAEAVTAHTAIEERAFYPAILWTVKAQHTIELLLASIEEHRLVRRLLSELLAADVMAPQFEIRLAAFAERLAQHDRREEDIFPHLQRAFRDDELEALGQQMESMFAELVFDDPRYHVAVEAEPAPSHF